MFIQLAFYHPPIVIVIRFTVFNISMIIYALLMNYFGQRIIDKTEEVFDAAYYKTKWYLMPPELRRYIHIIQNCSTQRKCLTAAKMGEVSLEAAATVIF